MPLERVSRSFRDISLTLKKNPLTRDLLSLQNEYAISRAVQNLVLTIQGEKFFDPNFGCAVNRLLFENIETKAPINPSRIKKCQKGILLVLSL